MAAEFCKNVLKVKVAQTCQNLGWNAINSTPLDIMIDILHKYLQELCRTTHRYCEQYGRTEANLDDLGLAFNDIGVSLVELEDYMNNVDPIKPAFEVPKFPIPHKNDLFSYKAELEPEEPEPEPETNTFEAVSEESRAGTNQESTLQQLLMAPTDGSPDETATGLKRANPESSVTPPQMSKRQRMMTDEELSNMNAARDLTSVFMTSGGLISPAREGKLPDAKTPQYTVPLSRPATPEDADDKANLPTGTEQEATGVTDGGNAATETKTEVVGDESVKKGGRKKPPAKPKKLNFGNKKVAAKKDDAGDKGKAGGDKPKKKTPVKNSKNQKKESKNASLSGITPISSKLSAESGETGASKDGASSASLDEIDSTIEAVIQRAREKDVVKVEKTSHDTSLDDTIEDVIQKAMLGQSRLEESIGSGSGKLRAKDIYDYPDSAGESSEPASVKLKEKTPPKPVNKAEDAPPPPPPKSDKKKARGRLTKAARKEFVDDPKIPLMEVAEPPGVTSPFHNPPGFPSHPPLPPLHGFHAGLHPSFTTNLGPPPPAHQGASPSMLLSPRFYPPFPPPMHNLPQFGDLSRLGMMPLFSSASSQYPSMLPTPAHTPHPFYSSTNEIPAHSIPVGAAENPFTTDRKTEQASSSSMQTLPVQVVSIKSEPKSASQSAKIEIKSSMLSPIISESTSSTMLLPPTKLKLDKPEPVEKPEKRSKEHKKDKRDKSEKKEKSKKKDKKEKVKDEAPETKEAPEKAKGEKKDKGKSKEKKKSKVKEESAKDEPLQKITLKFGSSSKIYIKPVSSPAPPEAEEEIKVPPTQQPVPVKSPPTPPPPPKPTTPPPPPPKPPAIPSPPPPVNLSPPPQKFTPAPVSASPPEPPVKSSPAGRGRKKGRPPKSMAKKYATRTPAPAPPQPPPPPVVDEPEESPSMSLITETVGATLDEDGNKIWICPKCGRPDDGSAMIGCDSCDDWYHWVCVKIVVPPKEEDSWFCTRCISKQQQQLQARRKKKKHKRDK